MRGIFFKWFVVFLSLWTALGRKHEHNPHHQPFHQRPLHARAAYAGICKDNPPDTAIDNVTIGYAGTKVMVNADMNFTRQINTIEKAIVIIRRCTNAAEEKNCELFHTWRFGKETCFLITQKKQLWSAIFNGFQPPLKCPIQKGEYKVVNATLDADVAQVIFSALPLEKYFWRIRIDAYDPKFFVCIVFGGDFVR